MKAQLNRAIEFLRDALSSRVAHSYSRLFIVSDGSGWVLNEEARELNVIATSLGIRSRCLQRGSARGIRKQVLFHSSQWVLRDAVQGKFDFSNRLTFSYFHGKPTPEHPEFAECLEAFQKTKEQISRVQVSNTAMRNLLLETGIAAEKVALIPIGINLSYFPLCNPALKAKARYALGIPSSARVIGSFQKDGNGWDEGLIPKLIKGPDIFLNVIESLKSEIPELFVLLSGPSRGYVKKGLETLKVPFKHVYLPRYADISTLYHAVDLTLVTSREEGGPKAILESMASGIPLVSTRVGQAVDMLRTEQNAWMAEVDDVDALSHYAKLVLTLSSDALKPTLQAGRETAELHSYPRQIELWRNFFQGVVE